MNKFYIKLINELNQFIDDIFNDYVVHDDDIYDSIESIRDTDGVYEIHPLGTDVVSGYIEVDAGTLIDYKNKEPYTEKDIWDISCFEEEHRVYYKKIK